MLRVSSTLLLPRSGFVQCRDAWQGRQLIRSAAGSLREEQLALHNVVQAPGGVRRQSVGMLRKREQHWEEIQEIPARQLQCNVGHVAEPDHRLSGFDASFGEPSADATSVLREARLQVVAAHLHWLRQNVSASLRGHLVPGNSVQSHRVSLAEKTEKAIRIFNYGDSTARQLNSQSFLYVLPHRSCLAAEQSPHQLLHRLLVTFEPDVRSLLLPDTNIDVGLVPSIVLDPLVPAALKSHSVRLALVRAESCQVWSADPGRVDPA